MRKTLSSLALVSSLFALPALAETTEWALDASHTHIGFSVPHLVISEVDGQFKTFSGKVLLDEKDATKSEVSFSIKVDSINTDSADRDKHLVGPDFFDSAKFPEITFVSKKITKAGKGFKLTGDLTMHGVTKSVTLDATLSQAVPNPWGKQVRAVKVTGKVNRQDFGVAWNKTLDKGGVAVGDQVALNIKLELTK
jgi:polyisoprenoid-binding protein YceI